MLFGELTVGRIASSDWEAEQTFFGKRPKISFSLLMPRWRAWLKKRDAIKSPQEKLEFTTARVIELQDRIEKLRK